MALNREIIAGAIIALELAAIGALGNHFGNKGKALCEYYARHNLSAAEGYLHSVDDGDFGPCGSPRTRVVGTIARPSEACVQATTGNDRVASFIARIQVAISDGSDQPVEISEAELCKGTDEKKAAERAKIEDTISANQDVIMGGH